MQQPTNEVPLSAVERREVVPVVESRVRSIALLSADIFLFWAALYLFVPILSVYARQLGASLGMVGLIIGSYGVTQLILRLPLGIISDRWRRRKPFVIVAFAVTVMSVLGLAWSPTPTWLLIFRALTGVSASTWVTTAVLYNSYFPKEQSVRASSLALFFMGAAVVLTAVLGGTLADAFGGRSTFYLATIPAVLGLALSLLIEEDTSVASAQPFSLKAFRNMEGLALLLVSSVLSAVTQYTAYATTFSFVPIYAKDLGASATVLGWLSLAVLLPNTLTTLVVGQIAEVVGERSLLVVGFMLMATMTGGIPFIKALPLLIASRVVYGIGQAMVHPVCMGLSIKQVRHEQRATAMGFFQAVYALGMSAGPAFSGFLADRFGMANMFWINAAICAAAILIVLRFIRDLRG